MDAREATLKQAGLETYVKPMSPKALVDLVLGEALEAKEVEVISMDHGKNEAAEYWAGRRRALEEVLAALAGVDQTELVTEKYVKAAAQAAKDSILAWLFQSMEAYKKATQEPDLKPQAVFDDTPEAIVARGLNQAGYILEDRHGVEVERGTLDEVMAYLHRNHPYSWTFAGALGYTLRAI